ncbi:MAG: ATP-dependent sacrificial sulfur transferase LarE, partial [Phycisphaerae bacterium]
SRGIRADGQVVLLAAAHRQLGDKALGCIGVSPSYPEREMRDAVNVAEKLGAHTRLVPTEEHLNPHYAANPDNRCYYCKTELFDRLAAIAKDGGGDKVVGPNGYAVVLDGNNADDLADVRPGRIAAQEHGVRSPLVELGITKAQVRELARELGLAIAEKPAMACLSSRVPHGTPIVPGLLKKIELAEDALAKLGFRQYRVRHHGEIARIELPAADLPRALTQRQEIVTAVRAVGYRFVTLDLAGFRSGE